MVPYSFAIRFASLKYFFTPILLSSNFFMSDVASLGAIFLRSLCVRLIPAEIAHAEHLSKSRGMRNEMK